MDIKVPVVGSVSQGGSVAALPAASANISAQAQAVVSRVAADTALSPAQRTGLVSAVAAFDQQAISKSTREVLFSQVEGLGTYLRNTSTTSWPRWQQLTALRVYGLNVEQGAKSDLEEVVIAQTKKHLNAVREAAATARPAPQAAPQPVAQPAPAAVARQAAAAPAPKLEIKVDAPKAPPVQVKVDKLV